ncbi:MAG: radical SAM protein [Planctomycetes bacterium]|nr:radical SAM protein [Planctomycetota bacterium]
MKIEIDKHPCFNKEADSCERIHLPVAPRCNVLCNFCNRKFDCLNESRPGVTSKVLSPTQALNYMRKTQDISGNITVVGIAGPGDPFACPDETMETLRLIRKEFPEMILCVATNGLELYPHIDELSELDVSHVTITINAVDPTIASEVYGWGRYNKKVLRGMPLGELIFENQLKSISKLKECGMIAKVNSIVIPGVNVHHIPEIAKTVAALGADIMNQIPMVPVEGTAFEENGEPSHDEMTRLRFQCAKEMPQMSHCNRCRADAAGSLDEGLAERYREILHDVTNENTYDDSRPYVAAASLEGLLVNQHLGEARKLTIYGRNEDGSLYNEGFRSAPRPGGADDRWKALGETLKDCRAILVHAVGERPKKIMEETGIRVVEMEGMIEEGARYVYNNQELPASLKHHFAGCGTECKGNGQGCA